METAAVYQILIEGFLNHSWSDWFEGMQIHHREDGDTLLEGYLPDQCALHGVLTKIRDLGLTLIEVKRIEYDSAIH